MQICFSCAKPVDASICLYQKNYYHANCCRICTPNHVAPVKEKAPPMPPTTTPPPPPTPKVEIADAKKARAGPGRLSFSNVASFETSKDVSCVDCKKKITGQRYLTYKLGEFRCEKCNSVIEDKCSMCKSSFETEECFKDDDGNKLCKICIKKYQDEKKKNEIEKQKKAAAAAVSSKPPLPSAPLPPTTPVKITNIIHCDSCTKSLKSDILEFEGGQFHPDCLVCFSCKTKLQNQKIYKEEKGLACQKCKHTPKCDSCKKEFSGGESYYESDDNKSYCIGCYIKHHSKTCSNCPNKIIPGMSYITFEEKNYHFECFLCGECKSKIGSDNKEFYMDASKKKYCGPCVKTYTSQNKGPKPLSWTAVVFIDSDLPSCFECKKQFNNSESFYQGKDNQPNCENCYIKLNSQPCSGCSNPIKPGTSFLKFEDKNFHFECFLCGECKRRIGSDSKDFYMDTNKKKYCEPCVNKNKGQTTKWTAIVYYETNSVPNCNECKKKLSNNESFFLGKDEKPYCVECYSKLNSKSCTGCKKNIGPSEPTLSLGDRVFHKSCLNCYKCSKVLNVSDKIFPKGDMFSCEKCI